MRSALLAALALLAVSSSVHAEESVRIAVGRFRDALTIDGERVVVTAADGTALDVKAPLVLSPSAGGLRLGGKSIPYDVLRIQAPGKLALRGHKYHQRLEVSARIFDGKPELLVVHPIPLETYVVGIVSSELPGGWPVEALKAQAVAARTYAIWQKYRRLDLPYHMESTVLDQVYGGAQRETAAAREAVASTSGMVLTSRHHPAQTYFHAACGGATESAREGWGNALSYLPGSTCPYCASAPNATWRARVPRTDLDRALQPLLGESVQEIEVVSRSRTGRVTTAELRGAHRKKTVSGGDLRRLIGYTKMWSTWVSRLDVDKDGMVVEGKGTGHGVGLCQWGMRGMAQQGKRFEDILALYYPGAGLKRLY